MSLETLNELRSHLQMCRKLLEDLDTMRMREEIGYESSMKVAKVTEFIRLAIIDTMKATIACKQHKNIPITPHTVVLPKLIKGDHEYPGDKKIIEEEMLEDERDRQHELQKKKLCVYHPDPVRNNFIKVYLEMGGFPIYDKIPKIILKKPEMELLDICSFIHELKERREKSGKYHETAVYVLLCEFGTIYVGLSRINYMNNGTKTHLESVMERLRSHRNWHDSPVRANWTALFKVISLLSYMPGDKEDENLITLLLSNCFNDMKVRGGDYTCLGPMEIPKNELSEIKMKLIKKS